MKRKIKYTDLPPGDEPIGKLIPVEDFLPSPEELIFKEDDRTEITIELCDKNIKFFKKEAKKHQIEFEEVISLLLEDYALRNDDH